MKLTLDYTQRLNLHALLDAQRADVGSIRAIWAAQDKLALNADEETAIELKREFVGGLERTVWNPSLFIPEKEFEFTETEVARIRVAIEMGQLWCGRGSAVARTVDRRTVSSRTAVTEALQPNQVGVCSSAFLQGPPERSRTFRKSLVWC